MRLLLPYIILAAFGLGAFVSYRVTHPTVREVFDGTPESYSECILLCNKYMICMENEDGSIEKLTDWLSCSGLRINLRDKLKHNTDFAFDVENPKTDFANINLHYGRHLVNGSDFTYKGSEKKAIDFIDKKMLWKNLKNQEVRFGASAEIKASLISRTKNNSSEKEWEFVAWCSRSEDVKKAAMKGNVRRYKHSKYFISFIGYLDFKK